MSSFFGKKDTKEPLTAAAAEEGKAGNSAETKPGESSLNTVKGWLTDELNVAIAIGLFSICSASMLLLNKCVADAFHLDASVVIAQMSFAFIVLPVLPAAFLVPWGGRGGDGEVAVMGDGQAAADVVELAEA